MRTSIITKCHHIQLCKNTNPFRLETLVGQVTLQGPGVPAWLSLGIHGFPWEAFEISMAVIHLCSKHHCALSTLCSGSFSLRRQVLQAPCVYVIHAHASFQLREQLWNPISNFKKISYVSPSSATPASPLPQRSRVRSLAEPRSLLIFFVDVKIHSHLKLDLVT